MLLATKNAMSGFHATWHHYATWEIEQQCDGEIQQARPREERASPREERASRDFGSGSYFAEFYAS